MNQATAADHELIEPTEIVAIPMRDGVTLYAALFLPKTPGRYPTLFAASPYRFDNDYAPAYPMYLWRETGPVAWYVDHGYAFVHMDVRGTGRSGGEYRFVDQVEQRDLYDAIEWIATQAWSDGNVGGIGQSYYAMMQWFMAIQRPAHLKCIAPYDGLIDLYRASAFSGGIPGEFFNLWYNQMLRPINQYPAYGPSRELPWDMPYVARHHITYDAFWKERAAAEQLDKIKVPVYSIGLWTKVDLHLNGNIVGYQRIGGAKKAAGPRRIKSLSPPYRTSPASRSTRNSCCRSMTATSRAGRPRISTSRTSATSLAAPTSSRPPKTGRRWTSVTKRSISRRALRAALRRSMMAH